MAASLIALTHVGVLGAAVAAAFMIAGIFAYCWTISSEDRSKRAAEIIRAFRGLPKGPSRVAQPPATVPATGARDDRRKRGQAIGSRLPE